MWLLIHAGFKLIHVSIRGHEYEKILVKMKCDILPTDIIKKESIDNKYYY